MKKLPQLTIQPTHHPDCCPSISRTSIKNIVQLLPSAPSLTISIGSGTGLLEALLLRQHPTLFLRAIEVSENVNKYMPKESVEIVHGTWDLCAAAANATTWLFVYPRETSLLHRYMQRYGASSVRAAVWLGPVADFQEVDGVMKEYKSAWTRRLIGDCGLSQYEAMALWELNLDAVDDIVTQQSSPDSQRHSTVLDKSDLDLASTA